MLTDLSIGVYSIVSEQFLRSKESIGIRGTASILTGDHMILNNLFCKQNISVEEINIYFKIILFFPSS